MELMMTNCIGQLGKDNIDISPTTCWRSYGDGRFVAPCFFITGQVKQDRAIAVRMLTANLHTGIKCLGKSTIRNSRIANIKPSLGSSGSSCGWELIRRTRCWINWESGIQNQKLGNIQHLLSTQITIIK